MSIKSMNTDLSSTPQEFLKVFGLLTSCQGFNVSMMTSSNGNISRVTGPLCGEFTGHRVIHQWQRPVTRSFDVFFDLRLNTRLSKQSWGWWFETPSVLLWRHCRFVEVPVCQRFGVSTFQFVYVSFCWRFGLTMFWLSTFRYV